MEDIKPVILDFLGGAMEVGASAVLVELDGYRILLDCGLRQKANTDPLPDFRRIQERGGVDAIVVSHAHMDHTGTLPVISKAYPQVKIYATSMTIDLTRVLLYDSLKLMNRKEEGIPAYAQKDVELMFQKLVPVRYEQEREILPGLTLTLYQAGHIAGAACIYLQSKAGTVFYSGDFSGFAQNTIEGIRIPKLRPDIVITESTYGDRLHSNRQVEERQLVEAVRACIEKKGKMVIPAFALGRAQEVLLILKKAMNKGELPKTRIYVDGMIRDMNIAYGRNPWFLKRALANKIEKGANIFYSDEIQPVGTKDNRDDLLNTADPVIFVASSGMLTGGPSTLYTKKIAPMENGYILITGYQDEEAPGRKLQELLENPEEAKYLTIDGTRIPVRCTIKKIGISAHADKDEIQGMLERLSPRNVFLVHGDEQVITQLSKSLNLEYRTRIYAPKTGDHEEIYLKNPRKQLKKNFPYTLQKKEPFGEEPYDGRNLYVYLQKNYPLGKFTIAQIAYIWYGNHEQTEEHLEELEKLLDQDGHFVRDSHRLFLFRCMSEEEMEEAANKEGYFTQQELMKMVSDSFAKFPYKKIGYYEAKKELVLQFDFPVEEEEEFRTQVEVFEKQTGWMIRKKDAPNEHAMSQYLMKKFGQNIKKISIQKSMECVVLQFYDKPSEEQWREVQEAFHKLTTYYLLIEGETFAGPAVKSTPEPERDEFFYPSTTSAEHMVEQNLALSIIDAEFEDADYAPYKKGIHQDQYGKYIQLSFLSPTLGKRECGRIAQIAEQTGWKIRISDSVNQNVAIAIAEQCCHRYNAKLKKTPSYNPVDCSIGLAFAETEEELVTRILQEVQEATGLVAKVK